MSSELTTAWLSPGRSRAGQHQEPQRHQSAADEHICAALRAEDRDGIDQLAAAVGALVKVQLAADEATYREDWADDEDLEAMIANNAAKITAKWATFLGSR